jgi:hypothetical protein
MSQSAPIRELFRVICRLHIVGYGLIPLAYSFIDARSRLVQLIQMTFKMARRDFLHFLCGDRFFVSTEPA